MWPIAMSGDLTNVIFVLLVLLVIVTLVGHGIWVFFAWLFRASTTPTAEPARVHQCLYCKRLTAADHPRCQWCGRKADPELLAELDDVQATLRCLARVKRAGLIATRSSDELLARVAEYRQQLLPPVPESIPLAPEPVAVAPLPPEPPAPPPIPEPAEAPREKGTVPICRNGPEGAAHKWELSPFPAPPQPREPHRTLPEMLREFMEPHNIRWGELVGGLLFIVGAAALVITQWETLERLRYFRFLVFAAGTAAVFGLGLYAQFRWKLEATSRVLLTIAILLVPLNFLAMAGLARDAPLPLSLALDAASLAVFSALLAMSGRVLVPGGRWWQVGSVAGISAVILLLARGFDATSPSWALTAAGCLPVAIFAACTGAFLRSAARGRISPTRAAAIFNLTATGVFPTAMALGLLAYRGIRPGATAAVLDHLSIPLSLAAIPVLIAGLAVARRVPARKALEPFRTGGLWTALLAGAAMLVALGLAWPWPPMITLVGLFVCLTLAAAALAFDLTPLHAAAIAASMVAYLAGFYWLSGASAGVERVDLAHEMLRHLASARTGTALVGLVLALAGLAYLLSRRGRPTHGLAYAAGSAVVALASLIWVTAAHPFDPARATCVYGIYAAGSLALCAHFRRPLLAYSGLGLLMAAVGWGLVWRTGGINIQWAAAYALLALAMSALSTALRKTRKGDSPRLPERPFGCFAQTGTVPFSHATIGDVFRLPLAQAADFAAALGLVLGVAMAWIDQARIDHSLVPVVAVVALAAHWLLTAWVDRIPARTVLASLVVMAGSVHTLVFNYAGRLALPWPTAFLIHATLAVAAAVALAWAAPQTKKNLRCRLRSIFVEPLADTAVASSAAGLALLATVGYWPAAMSGCLFWLAFLWLALAVLKISPVWMALHQTALAAAVGVGAYAWFLRLPSDNWAATHLHLHHAVGIALSALALLWVALRIATGGRPLSNRLLPPGWPMPDQWLKHALCLAPFWFLILTGPSMVAGAWAVWGLLAVAAGLSLWERWASVELIDSILLAVALPCLVAASRQDPGAARLALHWGLAIAYLICSAILWRRTPIAASLRTAAARIEVGQLGPTIAHVLLVALAALPVIGLSISQAIEPLGRLAYAPFSPLAAEMVPLALVLVAFVGHAVRENCTRYLFGAGLVLEWMVLLGQLIHYAARSRLLSADEFLGLVQWPTIAAALWAIAWLAVRRPLDRWTEGRANTAGRMLDLQLALGYLGNALPLGLGLVALVLAGARAEPSVGAVGSAVGWMAFLLAAGAGIMRTAMAGRRLSPNFTGLLGMAALGLLACTIQGLRPDGPWGYRALMLGWASYSLLVAGCSWWAAGVWVCAAGLAAVLLALKAAVWHQEQLWAAAAIAVASLAGSTMAVWRRREGWAFASSLGANVAASLVVWHFHRQVDLERWSILLVQANALTSALVALVWLAARRRLYAEKGTAPICAKHPSGRSGKWGLSPFPLRTSPLLAAQVILPAVAHAVLAGLFLSWMATQPHLHRLEALQLSEPVGWLALVLTAGAAAWYLLQIAPERLFEAVAGLLFGLTLLAAAAGFRSDALGSFTPIYTLLISLATASLLVGQVSNLSLFSRATESISWTTLLAALAVGFALRWSPADPARPWIPAWTILCAAASLGIAAVCRQLPGYVWAAGLLVNLAGWVAWTAWGPLTTAGLIDVQVLCLALGGLAWSLVRMATNRVPDLQVESRRFGYAQAVLPLALALIAAMVVLSLLAQLEQPQNPVMVHAFRLGELVHVLALAATIVALVVMLWDRSARYALAALYAAALVSIGLGLARRELGWQLVCVHSAALLAAFALVMALVARGLPQVGALARVLRIPAGPNRWSADWFSPAEAAVVVAAGVLGVWVAIDFRFQPVAPRWLLGLDGRAAGPLAMVLLAGAAFATASAVGRQDRARWQDLTLVAGILVPAAAAWACLGPQIPAPWLHRFVIMLADAAACVVVFGKRGHHSFPDWLPAFTRATRWLGLVAGAAILAVFALEWHHYDPNEALLGVPAIAAVGVSLAVLAAACLGFALARQDPLGLDPRARTAYVYAAEVLVALIGIHLRLVWPELFRLGIIERYGMFIAMGLAFILAGVAELFRRRGTAVLWEPLERTALVLPMLPMIAFWLMGTRGPAVWFLIGAFYGAMAGMRRSFWLGMLAVLSANVGLWVLWHRMDLGLLEHPQHWLIPPALAALVAEYASRGRLPPEQAGAVRYVSLSVIYLSSSADMFIAGIGNSFILPLVLLGLSLLGILAGMALRIRSFLYLGLTFLLVVVAALLKHVTIDLHQTWVFWLAVIALGAGMLALFGLFEKRRNDVLAAMERFKTWQG